MLPEGRVRRGKTAKAEIVHQSAGRMIGLPAGYSGLLDELKQRIRSVQLKATVSVNRELISLYWYIGKSISERQRTEGWGRSVVDRLATDLRRTFPGMEGFSPSNIWRMRAFYLAWTEGVLAQPVRESEDASKLAQPVRELDGVTLPPPEVTGIPWGHNVTLVEKVKDPTTRLWYARQTVEHGWSRAVLEHQIESGLFKRQGKAITNFKATLPPLQSDLAQQVLKDPYNFDFLTLATDARERELEHGLIEHIRKFLLELGVGFTFVSSQYHLEVGGEDFYIDLLFYHLRLRCFVVIDLKMKPFKPEYAGKMNFYLSAVDDLLRHKDDRPSIGLILCKGKNRVVAEYALRDTGKPIGVSAYRITESLPEPLKGNLPTAEQLEAELAGDEGTKPS